MVARSDPQMPDRRGENATQSWSGSFGMSTSTSRNGESETLGLASFPKTLVVAYLAIFRSYTRAFIAFFLSVKRLGVDHWLYSIVLRAILFF